MANVCAKEIEDATVQLWELLRELLNPTGDMLSAEAVSTLHSQIDELWIPYCSSAPGSQFESICRQYSFAPAMRSTTHFDDRSMAARMQIHADADQFIHSMRQRLEMGAASNKNIFLSHAATDERIALLLKAEVERRLPGVNVFCSSDPTDLPPGTRWSAEIQQALQGSSMLMFVASGRSLQRPWVWFECGTFWFSGRKILPVCLGDVRKNTLSPPLWELQAVNADEAAELKTALDAIASATGVTLSDASQLEGLAEKLKELDRDADAVSKIASGWLGTEWGGNYLAYEGPYQNLPLIDDIPFRMTMQQSLKTAGYDVALYDKSHFANLGEDGRFVQLTDRKSWRGYVTKGSDRLIARPRSQ